MAKMSKTETQKRTQLKKEAMLKALEKTLGVVTPALKQADVSRCQYYQWLKKDSEFAARVADMSDVALDFAESKLHKQISGGNAASTIFYLKSKGKNRGYIERQEIDHSGNVVIEWGDDEAQ